MLRGNVRNHNYYFYDFFFFTYIPIISNNNLILNYVEKSYDVLKILKIGFIKSASQISVIFLFQDNTHFSLNV